MLYLFLVAVVALSTAHDLSRFMGTEITVAFALDKPPNGGFSATKADFRAAQDEHGSGAATNDTADEIENLSTD